MSLTLLMQATIGDYMNSNDKKKILNKVLKSLYSDGNAPRKHVSEEEYVRNMRLDQERDKSIALQKIRMQRTKDVEDMQSLLPDRFRLATARHIPQVEERLKRLNEKVGLHKTSLVFLGVVGAGKTWLAYGYILDAIKDGSIRPNEVSITTEFVLSAISKSGFSKDEKMRELLHPKHKVFIVDDVGQADFKDPSARNEVWFELIDHIYRNNLTLVMTTNLPASPTNNSLKKYLGSAVYSRLESITGGDFVIPADKDRRPEVLTQMESGDYKNNPY